MAISVGEYENALRALSEALEFTGRSNEPVQFKIARDASIQRFEFCIELAWKTSAKVLGSSSTTARPVIREMAQNGLISDPQVWFDFIEARNKSSYTYRESLAQEVFAAAQSFLNEGQKLLSVLKNK